MDNADSAFWMQMHSAGVIQKKEFSMCFDRQIDAARNGTIAGALTLGGTDPRLHLSPIVWSDNARASRFFTVRLKKMYIREGGGVSAEYDPNMNVHPIAVDEDTLNSGGVIVDSGTTDTYMTQYIGDAFKSAWRAATGKDYKNEPIKLTDEQLDDNLPTILFQIAAKEGMENGDPSTTVGLAGRLDGDNPADIVIAMPASHYMDYDPEDDTYTPRLYFDESSGSVLGANVMMGHDVVFDNAGKKIGWAESNCDYDLLLGELSSNKRRNKLYKTEDMVVLGDEEKCEGLRCKIGAIIGIFGALLLAFLSWRRFHNQSEKPKLAPMEDLQYRDKNKLEAGNEIEVTSSIGLV